MTQQFPIVVMLVSDGIPEDAIEATDLMIRHRGHPSPKEHNCIIADVLEDMQRCADDPDPEISTDARLAFKSATTVDYDRVRYFLGRPGDIDESFRMPTCIRYCFILHEDGQIRDWEPIAA